mgnify:CR=1 FL=1
MRRVVCPILIFTLVLLLVGDASAVPTRRDTVLAWDDGTAEESLVYLMGGGSDVVVEFWPPEWAHSITALQFYILSGEEDGRAARAGVWAPSGAAGGPWYTVGPCPQFEAEASDSGWKEVAFTVPLNLEDGDVFPGRTFYAGLYWLSSNHSWVGLDLSEPESYATFVRPTGSPGWWRMSHNAMIRAVVSNEYVSPVEPSSWTRVKALFR